VADSRVQKFAKVLVEHSTKIEPGDRVLIEATTILGTTAIGLCILTAALVHHERNVRKRKNGNKDLAAGCNNMPMDISGSWVQYPLDELDNSIGDEPENLQESPDEVVSFWEMLGINGPAPSRKSSRSAEKKEKEEKEEESDDDDFNPRADENAGNGGDAVFVPIDQPPVKEVEDGYKFMRNGVPPENPNFNLFGNNAESGPQFISVKPEDVLSDEDGDGYKPVGDGDLPAKMDVLDEVFEDEPENVL